MNKGDIEDYLKKSGDEKIFLNNLIENENGFASYRISGDTLVLLNVYSKNGDYWNGKFMKIARENGCKKIKFGTRRNYKGFVRKYNYKLVGYILEKEVR